MPEITYPVDLPLGELPGYLAVPRGSGPWPGVVIVFEAFGANDDMRAQADRFAAQGYVALLPDFYNRAPWLRCVRKAFRDLLARRGPTFAAIESARSWLAGQDDCTGRVGIIGFCMGGGFALVAAAAYDFQAASANYGMLPRRPAETLAGACPIVASYGGRDLSMRGAAGKLERTLAGLDVPHDVKEYPDAGHSFLTEAPIGPVMGVPARLIAGFGRGREHADDAWARTFAFFGEHLAGPAAKES